MQAKLNLKDSSDFACLLELMMPLKDDPQYACLPELFAILGHEKLIMLSKYAGGTTVHIPTLDELNDSIEALQWYYNVYILKSKKFMHVPFKYRPTVLKIKEVYDNDVSNT